MTFTMYEADIYYMPMIEIQKSRGNCMGQCVTWMLDILENKVRYLKPPEDLKRGKKYHQALTSMC